MEAHTTATRTPYYSPPKNPKIAQKLMEFPLIFTYKTCFSAYTYFHANTLSIHCCTCQKDRQTEALSISCSCTLQQNTPKCTFSGNTLQQDSQRQHPPKGQKTPKKGQKPQKTSKNPKNPKNPKKGSKRGVFRPLNVFYRAKNTSRNAKKGSKRHPPVGTGKNTLLQSLPDIKKSHTTGKPKKGQKGKRTPLKRAFSCIRGFL